MALRNAGRAYIACYVLYGAAEQADDQAWRGNRYGHGKYGESNAGVKNARRRNRQLGTYKCVVVVQLQTF